MRLLKIDPLGLLVTQRALQPWWALRVRPRRLIVSQSVSEISAKKEKPKYSPVLTGLSFDLTGGGLGWESSLDEKKTKGHRQTVSPLPASPRQVIIIIRLIVLHLARRNKRRNQKSYSH